MHSLFVMLIFHAFKGTGVRCSRPTTIRWVLNDEDAARVVHCQGQLARALKEGIRPVHLAAPRGGEVREAEAELRCAAAHRRWARPTIARADLVKAYAATSAAWRASHQGGVVASQRLREQAAEDRIV